MRQRIAKDIAKKKQANSYSEKVIQSTLFNYRGKLCGRQITTWRSICSISRAEVYQNAGLSHRIFSKNEKIYGFICFLSVKTKKFQIIRNPKGFPTI